MSPPTSRPARRVAERGRQWPTAVLAWLLVGVPLLWGIWQTLRKALLLFR